MRPIRVAFVIDELSRAGTESQLLALLRYLNRHAVEPTLILLDGSDELSQSLEPENCEVIRLGIKKLISPAAVFAAHRLRKKWQAARPDVVVAYFLDSAYFALPIAKWCGAKTVRVRNNLGYWLNQKHRILGRAVRPMTDWILTNSEMGRDALIGEGNSRNSIEVIENGVDIERFPNPEPVNLERPVVRIGCVANLRPVKNIDGLIRAAKVVCERFPHAQFDIAGDGEQRTMLEELIRESNLTRRFHLKGSVSDIPAFLTSSEIAVLPSHSEGMSNAILEYMAAGRAIIATDVGANRNVLADSGVIVPPSDDMALSSAMIDLLSQPSKALQLGMMARRRVEQYYSRSAMVDRFTRFFQNLSAENFAGRSSTNYFFSSNLSLPSVNHSKVSRAKAI